MSRLVLFASVLLLMAPDARADFFSDVFGPLNSVGSSSRPQRSSPEPRLSRETRADRPARHARATAEPARAAREAAARSRPRLVALQKPGSIEAAPYTVSGGARPDIQPIAPEVVSFPSDYAAGSIIIDTSARRLYLVISSTEAYRYPISVGREGFEWTGTETVSRKLAWPDWRPPAEMRERDPSLPELMTGGLQNPLGAMAIYLGDTLYRIHGTNDVKSIGRAASSGCFRMRNDHVVHLASLVEPGATVAVLDELPEQIQHAVDESTGHRRGDRHESRRKERSS